MYMMYNTQNLKVGTGVAFDWKEFRDVECEFSVDCPMIYITAKPLGGKNGK